MVCSICHGSELVDNDATGPQNAILSCSTCGVNVHQLCFGVAEYLEDWQCSWCLKSDEGAKKKCELCPSDKGALKPTTDKKWVHMLCALYHPKTRIENAESMEPIDISRIRSKDFEYMCCICSEPGACIKCNSAACTDRFHITCAQKEKGLRELEKNGRILFRGLCTNHSLKKRRTLTSERIERCVRERRVKHLNLTAKSTNSEWIANHVPTDSTIIKPVSESRPLESGRGPPNVSVKFIID